MNQRTHRKTNTQPANGGNVLFTLGLVSVVALLIVGWVMTQQGGVGALANVGKDLTTISLNPTPATIPTPIPTVASNPPITQGPSVDEIIALYEEKLKSQQETSSKQMEELRKKYEKQIVNLKTELQLLETENKTLRGGE